MRGVVERNQFVGDRVGLRTHAGFVVRGPRGQACPHHARNRRLDLPRRQAGHRRVARFAGTLPGHDAPHRDVARRAVDLEIDDPRGPARIAVAYRVGCRRCIAGRRCGTIESEAAPAHARMGTRVDLSRCAPCRALADHPDNLARPRVPRRIEMLQAQRDRVAPQRAGKFVDEGFAGEHVRVFGNRVAGIGEFDRRLRVPVDERRVGAGIRAFGRRTVRCVKIVRGRLRAIAPGRHSAVGRGPRFDVERDLRVCLRIADRPGVARVVCAQGIGADFVARLDTCHALRCDGQACVRLHRRLAGSVPRDARPG
ncbi:hypothetical protein BLA6863_07571 [Burkholderia lata]|uniref:Uncharacterized protein n=1 Tax=Burkholderia lata (strain ATCC 17760 / DSM 23089 / LMG 22485 / NCIMB 9086 / R18194 / 383) TaxID=482957 RepID=A0A6P2SD13_BURL3|nr:hypothetical protein BLA6863_07571 [Burkholderia lata]